MDIEELGLHQHQAWAGEDEPPGGGHDQAPLAGEDYGRHCHSRDSHHPRQIHAGVGGQLVGGQDIGPQAAEAHGGHHRDGDSHHPRQVLAGVGGQPVCGQDNAPQAAKAHGYKHHGTVLPKGNKDTVNLPVNTLTLTCGYKECPISRGTM